MYAKKQNYRHRFVMIVCLFFCATALLWLARPRVAQANGSALPSPRAHIVVSTCGKTYEYRDELLPAPDHTVLEQIERRNINAPLPEKIKTVDACLSAGAAWREAMKYAFPRLPAFVQSIVEDAAIEPVDSKIEFRPQNRPMFRITRARTGRAIDENKLYQELYFALRRSPDVSLSVKPMRLPPAVTEADNAALTHSIANFATGFSTSGAGRKHNIALALSKIDGAVLRGGETFSFNSRVGARTVERGFDTAKIIVDGAYTDGVGGGVCQVSTTLYGAALRAGMRIDAVRGHTLTPSYVPPSLDAMVNAGWSDLRFTNPYETPVFIHAYVRDDTACVVFYGAELPHVICPVSRVISRSSPPVDREVEDTEHSYFSPDAPKGTRMRVANGHEGVVSEAYLRYFTRAGKFIREEKIRRDTYAASAGIVAVAP